jgi:hypothetical protein
MNLKAAPQLHGQHCSQSVLAGVNPPLHRSDILNYAERHTGKAVEMAGCWRQRTRTKFNHRTKRIGTPGRMRTHAIPLVSGPLTEARMHLVHARSLCSSTGNSVADQERGVPKSLGVAKYSTPRPGCLALLWSIGLSSAAVLTLYHRHPTGEAYALFRRAGATN